MLVTCSLQRGGGKKKKKKALWAKRKGRALIDEPCKLTVVPSRSCQCVSAKNTAIHSKKKHRLGERNFNSAKLKKKQTKQNKTKKCKKCSVHGSPPLDKKHSGNVMTTR